MKIDIKDLVSISEANQNFSRVARLVDEHGAAIILKTNVPRYVLMEIDRFQQEEEAKDEDVELIAKCILNKHS